MRNHVLVTGANGFVGSAVCKLLLARGHQVSGAVRRPKTLPPEITPRKIDDIGPATDWMDALFTVDTVIHLAARVHVMHETAKDPLAHFRKVNTEGTLHLARQAAAQGVRRLVFVSTIKVNGEATEGRGFTEFDPADPADPYAQSKWEAEQGLKEIAAKTGLEVVIVRPPLVYGPGVKGNFRSLIELCAKHIPLPLKNVLNRRAVIYVDNLAHALVTCATADKAAGQTYLVRDDTEPSTPKLVEMICAAMGKKPRLIAVPAKVLSLAGRLTGQTAALDRLLGSLSVDDTKIRQELGWAPPVAMDVGLKATVKAYKPHKK
ncbi:MAG: hypothetical protein A2516_05730 [Alphaproteobacteria bacterium RIFOXYD12_FULL_60_8]|nr:MAG: hypothetical protein A2516_05730 [Alphaproteobacteria bacterium RIFOXYD12_FULL_60_8]